MIDLLERRLAAADSSVRLQAVRGISDNIARFSAVLLLCPAVIGADRVSEELDAIATHRVKPAGVLLGDVDSIEQRSDPHKAATRTVKTPNVEVIIADRSD